MLEKQLQASLDRRQQRGTLRRLTTFQTRGPTALSDFSSNDYLSLARHVGVRGAFTKRMESLDEPLLGSTGSRLLDGNSPEHEGLERRLAAHMGASTALLFNSGYDANSSLLAVLPQPDDWIIYDELVHASVHDGMRASRTRKERRISLPHNDMDHLRHLLASGAISIESEDVNVFVAVESVYSMDGDLCPLQDLVDVVDAHLNRSQRCVIVDEAHGVGMYGRQGAGLCNELDISQRIDVRLATFGKAIGTSGAAVLCSHIVRQFLINYARPLVFSTALPYPILHAVHAALDILEVPRSREELVDRTFDNTQRLLNGFEALAAQRDSTYHVQLPVDIVNAQAVRRRATNHVPRPSPIVPLLTPRARELAAHLVEHGFLVRPICYPTVPKGKERVRICVHAHNSAAEVQGLVDCVAKWLWLASPTTEQPRSLPRQSEHSSMAAASASPLRTKL
ncbi:PLP-dependent transferase [Acaromyces ingoldii]|uniref:PLP-dependent transferase n=1 Tax=Acaromyces ingoldii TaxID=215250 RepID=A0A316YI26_9BASI|nr:PLP-dependent transferase [Acaromyces ingoldii]PWN88484.1 PLP-dependent transferase [Acaromyces ingoldii]